MSLATKILPHYTYEDWLHWEGRWELIEGFPYAMSPMPIPQHQIIANNLGAIFYIALKECKACKVMQAIDYKVAHDTIIQPDVLIVCKEIEKKYLDFPPSLVVEILSPSTALKDRHTKFEIYEQQKVAYYIIINPQTEHLEIFSLKNDAYQLEQEGDKFTFTFTLGNECVANVDFSEIW